MTTRRPEYKPTTEPDGDGVVYGSDLERRADVDSLDRLHDERRRLYRQYARLIALYGPFGIWDDRRKQMLEAFKTQARAEQRAAGAKVTNDEINELAHANPAYQKFLDDSLDDKIRYLQIWNRISEINELIQSRAIALSAYKAELRLDPGN